MKTARLGLWMATVAVGTLGRGLPVRAQEAQQGSASKTAVSDWKSQAKTGLDRGTAFLKSRQKNGLYEAQGQPEPGITSLALTAILRNPGLKSEEREAITRRGLEYIVSLVQPEGAIYAGGLANYVTASSILALAASGNPKYQPIIARAKDFLVRLQLDEGDKVSPDDPFYGGTGYSEGGRPDLSNMNLWMDGIRAAGVPKEDDAYKKALVFLNRCQNRSESNSLVYTEEVDGKKVTSVPGNDGGAYYKPGESKAGYVDLPDGKRVPRSYGSMTYALLKCYLLAGMPKDDPRLAAAVNWIRANYTLEENPGFEKGKDPNAGYQGLYYYYLTLAQALAAYGEDTITDSKGVGHRWREELSVALLKAQKPDGSWSNSKDRWWESNPDLVTSYAMLALETCMASN